jgi:hypothetical protein
MSAENSVNIFERATRLKLRFDTSRGFLTTEDLWGMPLTSGNGFDLDAIARGLHRRLKDAEEVSFVVKTSGAASSDELAFEVVKHVIETKLAEQEAAKMRAANREKKQKLLSLIAEKQDESLKASSVEELQAMVEAL